MRTLRHAACIVVAVGSIALSAWQPELSPGHTPAVGASAGQLKPVEQRLQQQPVDRAVISAPLLKT